MPSWRQRHLLIRWSTLQRQWRSRPLPCHLLPRPRATTLLALRQRRPLPRQMHLRHPRLRPRTTALRRRHTLPRQGWWWMTTTMMAVRLQRRPPQQQWLTQRTLATRSLPWCRQRCRPPRRKQALLPPCQPHPPSLTTSWARVLHLRRPQRKQALHRRRRRRHHCRTRQPVKMNLATLTAPQHQLRLPSWRRQLPRRAVPRRRRRVPTARQWLARCQHHLTHLHQAAVVVAAGRACIRGLASARLTASMTAALARRWWWPQTRNPTCCLSPRCQLRCRRWWWRRLLPTRLTALPLMRHRHLRRRTRLRRRQLLPTTTTATLRPRSRRRRPCPLPHHQLLLRLL